MHKLGEVAHLDLKLENILLTDDFRVKLCDFGFSQPTKHNCSKNLGTDGYKAPEIRKLSATDDESSLQLLKNGYSGLSADLFALGVILFTLHYGIPPFQIADAKQDRLYKLISFKTNSSDKKAAMKFFLRSHPATKDLFLSNSIDYELMDLIVSLLSENPAERPQNIDGIKAHPYFRKEEISTFSPLNSHGGILSP